MTEILIAVGVFAAVSIALGLILAFASNAFKVEQDTRIDRITELLPGANCGGCGYAGCGGLASAIVEGKASPELCVACEDDVYIRISSVMGIEPTSRKERYRAQVMCSGTCDLAKKKYIYEGLADCVTANRLSGGDKLCPEGCIGLGSCMKACKFDAIRIVNGVATVDYNKCRACGACVSVCPKHIISLIPYNARHWVGCSSTDKGSVTKSYCDIGCIGCKICEKNCPVGAISVENNLAKIDYSLCTGCDTCIEKCPRKVIWSNVTQGQI